jgi:hypothetical protein
MPKGRMPHTLQLRRGDVLLGTIDVKPGDADLPWRSGSFHPAPEFEAVRGLFEHELRLLRANTQDDAGQWEDWEAVHDELNDPALRLEASDQSYAEGEILIHIDGSEAWWRSD